MGKDIVDVFYDAWEPSHHEILKTSRKEFEDAIIIKIGEINESLAQGDTKHALFEMADIISLSLNWMRSKGLVPQDMRDIISERIRTRYLGNTNKIIKKYRKLSLV